MKVLCSAISLAAGATIYLLWRTPHLLAMHLLVALGCERTIGQMRTWASTLPQPSGAWQFAIYSLPGGLWSLSYVLLAAHLGLHRSLPYRMGTAAVIPALGVGSELLQAAGWLPGTFDVADALCYAAPYIAYISILKIQWT